MNGVFRDTVTLTIDGRRIRAKAGQFVLQAARDAGISIPTLCDHPALEPAGACRVCVVEVTHPDWGGWHGLMTSCLYPVSDGIEVFTNSHTVREARRRVLSLLAARSPGATLIQEMASEYDANTRWLVVEAEGDNCILCGLCTRVCASYATTAIGTSGRGADKQVGPFAGKPPDDCVGCGACAMVCPTGVIEAERTAADYRIWERVFPTSVCVIDTAQCIGCGACEEACPFHVARVVRKADGTLLAHIPAEHCRGCGACVAPCPTGAIRQETLPWEVVAPRFASVEAGMAADKGTTAGVVACQRSTRADPGAFDGHRALEVPCVGRVSVPLLLYGLTQGLDGVLVLGRHQSTCRLDGAEDPAVAVVTQAREVARMVGIHPDRIRFDDPPPGRNGPGETFRNFAAMLGTLEPDILSAGPPSTAVPASEGLDGTLEILDTFYDTPRASVDFSVWCGQEGIPVAGDRKAALNIDRLPLWDVLTRSATRPTRLVAVIRAALEVLPELGVPVDGVTWLLANQGARSAGTICCTLCPEERRRIEAAGVKAFLVDDLIRERGARLPRLPCPDRVACDGHDQRQVDLLDALGLEPVDVGRDPLPDRFALSSGERTFADARLVKAEAAGAHVLLTTTPRALVRWGMMTRQGTWRTSRVVPVSGVQLAAMALSGTSPSAWAVEAGMLWETSSREATR